MSGRLSVGEERTNGGTGTGHELRLVGVSVHHGGTRGTRTCRVPAVVGCLVPCGGLEARKGGAQSGLASAPSLRVLNQSLMLAFSLASNTCTNMLSPTECELRVAEVY